MTSGLEPDCELVDLEARAQARFLHRAPQSQSGKTVVIHAGLSASAIDAQPYRMLGEALLRAGWATVAVEWRGPEAGRTITSDVEASAAVMEVLAARGLLSPERSVLFGHSLGALAAALLAGVLPVAGVVVYGAAARRWAEALERAAEQQLPLRMANGADARVEASRAGLLYRSVLRAGRSREQIAALEPHLLETLAAGDLGPRHLFGAPISYLRSVDAIEPRVAWQRVQSPVCAIQGELDWVAGEGDASTIASWVRAQSTPAKSILVPRADHYFGEHESVSASMRDRGRGMRSSAALQAVVAGCDDLLNHG